MVTYKELLHFVWQFMRLQKWVFVFVLIMAFGWSLDALLWPYILHLVVDIFTRFETDRFMAWDALRGPIIGGLALVLIVEGGFRTMGFLLAKAIPRLEANIRMTMFKHIQQHSPRYFNERMSGSLANKITDMTTQVTSIIQQLTWPIIPAFGTCLLGMVFLWFVNPIFAVIMAIWSIVQIAACLKFTPKCDAYEHAHGEARSTLLGKIVDSLQNNFAVNLFYRFREERSYLAPYQKDEELKNYKAKHYVEVLRSFLTVFYFLSATIALNGSMIYLWMHDKITTGQVVQVFNTGFNLTVILWQAGVALPALFQSLGIAKQAYSLMLDPQDIKDKSHAQPLQITTGEIIFDDVAFHYGENKLFQNKHAHIRGGEKVGLVGYTGSGKSTFVNLILRFYPLKEGKILIDGQPISDVTLESLRQQIALIPQDPMLFHRSLKENILFGNPKATNEEVITAAKLAHSDEFIRNMSNGYDAIVGERGTKLSGGEKQRIAIARAILLKAPILILDEATSALDSVTEKYIQDSLDILMENRTTIVIAHRLSTLSRMDRILVFDKGKIVEEGSHVALLELKGLYAKMWQTQVGGFLPLNEQVKE